ncbi:hypothetical protein OCU04_007541 [Sclerotinia nivalis]|uniref:Uncharacterized protein n=1 Tax=Sclerotinia nivalis TaxID=352851 RepID=A0A9X0DHF8_9HELO|nr:hypothetical protein OCU04_007541 [Sclerotinia nivalis]
MLRRVGRNILFPLIEERHRDVTVFTHSYGRIVGDATAGGFSKSRIVLATKQVVSLGLPSPGFAIISSVIQTLYTDTDASLAPALEAAMIPHALAAF